MTDDDLHVARWTRFGKDRLYVTCAGDTKIGFWDLVAGTAHPVAPEYLPLILRAANDWRAGQGHDSRQLGAATHNRGVAVSVACERPPERSGSPELAANLESGALSKALPDARPWLDLTTNEPGAEAREQALAAREAAPVKTLLARVLRVHTDERAWRIGADGEEKVAAQLAKAAKKDPRWHFIHAIPVGTRGSDIDHLVIGPGGVFAVNAKHHPRAKIWVGGSTFLVNGTRQPYIRNSRYEAGRAANLLANACGFPVHVEGLIVTVNARDVVVKNAAEGVHVVPRMQVAKWLLRHGDLLTEETVQRIYDAARRSTTWRS